MHVTKMESRGNSNQRCNSIAKKLLHMFKVVYYMLRKGIISKQKLMMDLHLLLKRGKLARKALGNLMTFHGHHHTDYHSSSSAPHSSSSFFCMSVDPILSFYDPREVEFSCSNTPSYSANITSRKHHHHHHRSNKNYSYDDDAVAAIAKAFEMLNSNSDNTAADMSDTESVMPSPYPVIAFGKSPAMVPQLRITDSPFPIKEDEAADGRVDKAADGRVDKAAEEFIRRFYEQLRMQPATPEYRLRRGA